MNLALFAEAPVAIQIHAVAALGALVTGSSLLILPRGRKAHRTLGIITAVLLAVTAFSAIRHRRSILLRLRDDVSSRALRRPSRHRTTPWP